MKNDYAVKDKKMLKLYELFKYIRVVSFIMQNDIDPTEIEPAHPAIEGLYPAIDEVKNAAIDEIKKASKESTKLSYRLLIAGAMFGFLGSFLVSALLRFWPSELFDSWGDVLLAVIAAIAFFGSVWIVVAQYKKLKGSKK